MPIDPYFTYDRCTADRVFVAAMDMDFDWPCRAPCREHAGLAEAFANAAVVVQVRS